MILTTALLLLFAADPKPAAPTAADALALKDAQIRFMAAQAALNQILSDPVVVKARAALLTAQEALEAETKKHPGCELQADNSWRCASPVKPATP